MLTIFKRTPASPNLPSQKREIYLDFVRGIAILMALGYHFNGTPTGIPALDLILSPGITIGWAGVDVFFVLSGFLIGGLIFKEYQASNSFLAKRFLIRRAFKIWPIFYLYLFLILITKRFPWQSFFFQNFFHVQNYFLTPLLHLWSLAVEEQFYLLFAFLFFLYCRSKPKDLHILPKVLIGICILCPILRTIAYLNAVDAHLLQVQTQYRIDALAFGVFLAYLKSFNLKRFEALAHKKILLFLAFAICIVLLTFFHEHKDYFLVLRYSLGYLLGASILLFCYKNPLVTGKYWIVKIVSWLGVYSYAMYLFQFVMYRVFEAIFSKLHIEPSGILQIFIKYAGAIGIAYVITKLVEKPILKLREKVIPS
jgi:peptidoglycan/LPS O-acetylase OafA/YrhL